jgi:hypothetical protein
MPRPGKAPLKRFHLVNGPVYLQASLERKCVRTLVSGHAKCRALTYALAQGSFAGTPADATNFFISNPVWLIPRRGAIMSRGIVSARAHRSSWELLTKHRYSWLLECLAAYFVVLQNPGPELFADEGKITKGCHSQGKLPLGTSESLGSGSLSFSYTARKRSKPRTILHNHFTFAIAAMESRY